MIVTVSLNRSFTKVQMQSFRWGKIKVLLPFLALHLRLRRNLCIPVRRQQPILSPLSRLQAWHKARWNWWRHLVSQCVPGDPLIIISPKDLHWNSFMMILGWTSFWTHPFQILMILIPKYEMKFLIHALFVVLWDGSTALLWPLCVLVFLIWPFGQN